VVKPEAHEPEVPPLLVAERLQLLMVVAEQFETQAAGAPAETAPEKPDVPAELEAATV
jgi:hypothetical protein